MNKPRTIIDSPGSVLVLNHYRDIGLMWGWDRARVDRLCSLMRLTLHELGRLCCAFESPPLPYSWQKSAQSVRPAVTPTHSLVNACYRNNHFPPYLALHFAILEQWVLEILKTRGQNAGEPEEKPVMPVGLLYHTEPVHVHD